MEKAIGFTRINENERVSYSFLKRGVKRAMDILASFFGLLFLSPLFLLVAISIRHDSPGPVFYGGRRLGYGGKEFKILKFRTMFETPESYSGAPLTAHDDQRITKVGKWLRDTKLNELPQLWNVLMGQMSLVGPRPEDPEIAQTWSEETRRLILSVRPGLTSPASIIYRDEEKKLESCNVMDEYLSHILPDKLRLDVLYVKNQNFFTDLDVIFMTLILLMPRSRNSEVPEPLLYAGPIYNFVRRTFSWFLLDAITAFVGISVVCGLWRIGEPLNLGFGLALAAAIGISILFSIMNSILGLKKITWRSASPSYAIDLGISSLLTMIVVWLINWYALKSPLFPNRLLVDFGLLVYFGFVVTRYRERLITGLASRWVSLRGAKSSVGERVLIIGAGECGELAIWMMRKSQYVNAFSIAGYVDDDFRKQDYKMNDYPILGTTGEISNLVDKHNIGLIIFAISRCSHKDRERILSACKSTSARVVIMPDFIEIFRQSLLAQSKQEAL